MSISTHILDTAQGRPAAGVPLTLERRDGDTWTLLGEGVTDADGRNRGLLPPDEDKPGTYRIRFDTGAYSAAQGTDGFYPYAEVVFVVRDATQHFHVPLLLSPFGYSTYRGS